MFILYPIFFRMPEKPRLTRYSNWNQLKSKLTNSKFMFHFLNFWLPNVLHIEVNTFEWKTNSNFYNFSIGRFDNWWWPTSIDGRFTCLKYIFRCSFLSLSTNWSNTSQSTKYGTLNTSARASENLSLSFAVNHKLSFAGWRWSLQPGGKKILLLLFSN